MDNEKEQLQQIKEDLRKELIKNTQCISNLNTIKDKQPVAQQQVSAPQPVKNSIQETEGSDDEDETIALQAGNGRSTKGPRDSIATLSGIQKYQVEMDSGQQSTNNNPKKTM